MVWRIGATIMIVVFVLLVTWVSLASPLVEVGQSFQDVDTSGQFDSDSKIDGYIGGWFALFPLTIFGIIAWGFWYVYRQELTRGGL